MSAQIDVQPVGKKINVADKMDNRDCARLLDYYRMRIGNIEKEYFYQINQPFFRLFTLYYIPCY